MTTGTVLDMFVLVGFGKKHTIKIGICIIIDFITDAMVECVGVPVETVVALGIGVGQRPMEDVLIIIAKQTKIVKRTDPGIIVQVVVVVLRKQKIIMIGVKRLMGAHINSRI